MNDGNVFQLHLSSLFLEHIYKVLGRRKWQPTPVFLPGESEGWGPWWAAVYGVAQSRTRLKRLSSSSSWEVFISVTNSLNLWHCEAWTQLILLCYTNSWQAVRVSNVIYKMALKRLAFNYIFHKLVSSLCYCCCLCFYWHN